jgi:hypothetical protein
LGANVFGLYFAAYFMNLKQHDPLVHRQISRLIPVLASMLLAVPFFHYHVIGIILTIVSTLNSVVLMVLTVRGLMRKQREAYFYAAAWSSLLIGTFTYGLLALGFIQPNFFTEKGLQLGSFFEVTILSFALADRLNQLQLGLKEANSRLAHYLQHVEEQVLIKTGISVPLWSTYLWVCFRSFPGSRCIRIIHSSWRNSFTEKRLKGWLRSSCSLNMR